MLSADREHSSSMGIHDEVPEITFPITLDKYDDDETTNKDIKYLRDWLDEHKIEPSINCLANTGVIYNICV